MKKVKTTQCVLGDIPGVDAPGADAPGIATPARKIELIITMKIIRKKFGMRHTQKNSPQCGAAMGSLHVVGMEWALVLLISIPISLLLAKPTQIQLGLYCKTDRIPPQHTFVGLVSFDPGVMYDRQSIMLYITLEQSEFDGPGAGVATGEGDIAECDFLRAWMGANEEDSSTKTERNIYCFIIDILFF